MPLTPSQAKAQITDFVQKLGASRIAARGLTEGWTSAGKVYEAWCLTQVLREIALREGMTATLVGGTKVKLKASPGPINPSYPHFELRRLGRVVAELWTDIEFTTLSTAISGSQSCHELDIVVVDPGTTGHPSIHQLWLGVECKHWAKYEKHLVREALGVRRELSFLTDDVATKFPNWIGAVPATPSSAFVVYATDPMVTGPPPV